MVSFRDLRDALSGLSLPTLGREAEIAVYMVHNTDDAEDYFFLFDFLLPPLPFDFFSTSLKKTLSLSRYIISMPNDTADVRSSIRMSMIIKVKSRASLTTEHREITTFVPLQCTI